MPKQIDAAWYYNRLITAIAASASVDGLRIIATSPTAERMWLDRFAANGAGQQLFVMLCHLLLGPVVEPVGWPRSL
jgi:hypothetical protein